MTGRELILYILSNGLENEPVFKDGKFIGFMTEEEAAVRMDVDTATIKAWQRIGLLEGITVNAATYIPGNATSPMRRN